MSFREGILKLNPNLFYLYEKMNKGSKCATKMTKTSADSKLVEGSKERSREAASDNLSSRFKGPNNAMKSNLRLGGNQFNEDDIKS